MDPLPSTVAYPPSWRRIPWIAGPGLLWAWICLKHSHTYDEVDHRVALAGAWLFALFSGIVILRQVFGVPSLTLTRDGFTQRTWFEKKYFAWSRYRDFTVGTSFLSIESISFVERQTGVKESLFNFTKIPSEGLCQELSQWREKFGGPSDERVSNRT
jgi:hypothetical protein